MSVHPVTLDDVQPCLDRVVAVVATNPHSGDPVATVEALHHAARRCATLARVIELVAWDLECHVTATATINWIGDA